MERRSEWFCDLIFFCSNFKVEWENGVWTKIRFLGSGFLFTCGNFSYFYCFFRFFVSDFCLNGFPIHLQFILGLVFLFLACGFLFTWGISHWFSMFFFHLIFFKNGFLNSLIVHYRSSFSVYSLNILWIVRQDLSCYVFHLVEQKNVSLYLILPLFQHFAWNLFYFSRLVFLFSHSGKSDFEQQLLSKTVQNEQSQYKKLKSNRNRINP